MTVLSEELVGADADKGNRLAELVRFSVPARNRLIPSSWVIERVSVTAATNENRITVANAKFGKLRGSIRHAPVQVAGVGAAGVSEAKKPGIVFPAKSL